ncbi:hypothetical protein [Leptolyngbya sp. O-77]|uniref:hypothetical protein n=1 Tax=Leptolyngbya sp. O-77 TaxID=1080068 RepID=UPI00074D2D22|nr:hypothetical protein [Leptolyngbya sp. O-77]BAU41169.1 hypothetical protein O77CONTIG1_00976 [Leptolyngbya sp. O-77]
MVNKPLPREGSVCLTPQENAVYKLAVLKSELKSDFMARILWLGSQASFHKSVGDRPS